VLGSQLPIVTSRDAKCAVVTCGGAARRECAGAAALTSCLLGVLRVRVYSGVDLNSKRRMYLTEVVPPGPKARDQAEKVRTRLLHRPHTDQLVLEGHLGRCQRGPARPVVRRLAPLGLAAPVLAALRAAPLIPRQIGTSTCRLAARWSPTIVWQPVGRGWTLTGTPRTERCCCTRGRTDPCLVRVGTRVGLDVVTARWGWGWSNQASTSMQPCDRSRVRQGAASLSG
jgi:hypothetical protein